MKDEFDRFQDRTASVAGWLLLWYVLPAVVGGFWLAHEFLKTR